MDDYTFYKLYLAVKLHFTTESYNVFQTNGRVRVVSREEFIHKKGVGLFKTLAKKFESPQEAIQFFVAQSVYGEASDIFEFQKAFDQFTQWKAFKESSTYRIQSELNHPKVRSTDLEGNPPAIIRHIIAGRMSPQTGVALQRRTSFLDTADLKEHLLYQKTGLKIRKLDRFVKFDESKVFSTIDDVFAKSPLNTFGQETKHQNQNGESLQN